MIWLICLIAFLPDDQSYQIIQSIELDQRGQGLIGSVYGCHVDSDGIIYIADSKNANLKKYRKDGSFIKVVAGKGSGPGELQRPSGVTGDGGLLYVADQVRGLVNIFDASTEKFIKAWNYVDIKDIQSKKGLTVVGTVGFEQNQSLHILPAGRAEPFWALPIPEITKENRMICAAISVEIDAKQQIYAVHEMEYTVHKFSSDGKLLQTIQGGGPQYEPPANHPRPKDNYSRKGMVEWVQSWTHVLSIAVADPPGELWVCLANKDFNILDVYNLEGEMIAGNIKTSDRLLCADHAGFVYLLDEILAQNEERFVIKKVRL